MLPIPVTFVVGTDGIITARFVDPDYRKRMAIDDLIVVLRKAGERNPAEPSPGNVAGSSAGAGQHG